MSEAPEDPTASNAAGDAASDPRIDDVIATQQGGAPVSESAGGNSGRRPSALGAGEANLQAARQRPTVLVLAGGVGCGKTSVYAALYERLGRGPFAGRMFAGSTTIPGFEERCHYWRTSAGTDAPGMKHTQGMELPWLHIRLRDLNCERPGHELLLGDFDGELFDQLRSNEIEPHKLPFLRRADHLGVVVDGGAFADPSEREAERVKLMDFVPQLLKDPSAAPPALILAVTKLDLIDELEDTHHRAWIEQAIDDVHAVMVEASNQAVPIVRLAVRSGTTRFPLGHGLEDLLELLTLRPATMLETPPPAVEIEHPLGTFRA